MRVLFKPSLSTHHNAMTRWLRWPCLLLSVLLIIAGCASTERDSPSDDACTDPSGCPDGTVMTGDMGGDGEADVVSDGEADMPSNHDGVTDGQGGDVPEMMGGPCTPNRDDIITRNEVSFERGLRGTFQSQTDATVDMAGTMEDGRRVWDLVAALADGRMQTLFLNDPTTTWFAEDFPTATYYTELSTTSDLLGVFQATDTALLLLGVVSPNDGLDATRVSYDPPVPILQFPLEVGAMWSVETTVSGTFNGFAITYNETYNSQVDAAGTLKVPFASADGLPVLRVRTDMERGVWTFVFPFYYLTDVRTFAFVSECFNTVATVVSQEDVGEVEFSSASELRGLAP